MMSFLENIFFDNWKIKVYAFLFSLVLWSVILGQRSLVVTREVPIEFLVGPNASVQDAVDKIKVTIKAKRSVILSFNPESAAPMVDLRNLPPGAKRIPIKFESIAMPIGAKVIAIEPKAVTLFLKVSRGLEPAPALDSDEILVEKKGFESKEKSDGTKHAN